MGLTGNPNRNNKQFSGSPYVIKKLDSCPQLTRESKQPKKLQHVTVAFFNEPASAKLRVRKYPITISSSTSSTQKKCRQTYQHPPPSPPAQEKQQLQTAVATQDHLGPGFFKRIAWDSEALAASSSPSSGASLPPHPRPTWRPPPRQAKLETHASEGEKAKKLSPGSFSLTQGLKIL